MKKSSSWFGRFLSTKHERKIAQKLRTLNISFQFTELEIKNVQVQFDKFILLSGKESEASGSSNLSAVTSKKSELFDHIVYLSEVCDVMAIAMAELPNLLSPPDVAEALLRLKFGPQIICHMVANQPDSFNEGE